MIKMFEISVTVKEYAQLVEALGDWEWFNIAPEYSFSSSVRGFIFPTTGLKFEVRNYTIVRSIDGLTGHLLPARCLCDCGCGEENCYYCGECQACGNLEDDDEFKAIHLEFIGEAWGCIGGYYEEPGIDEVIELVKAQSAIKFSVAPIIAEVIADILKASDWSDRFIYSGDYDNNVGEIYASGMMRPVFGGLDCFIRIAENLESIEIGRGWDSDIDEAADLMDGNTLDNLLSWIEDSAKKFPLVK